MVELVIVPPDDNGGVEVYGYRVEYENYAHEFLVGMLPALTYTGCMCLIASHHIDNTQVPVILFHH